jgi:transposase-like protein
LQKKKKIQELIVDDETLIKVGNQFAWLLWIAVDSINKKTDSWNTHFF